jgi:hypothetical protein
MRDGSIAPKTDKAGDRVLVHGPNPLRLPPNITQSSGTLPVSPMLDRGEGGYRQNCPAELPVCSKVPARSTRRPAVERS